MDDRARVPHLLRPAAQSKAPDHSAQTSFSFSSFSCEYGRSFSCCSRPTTIPRADALLLRESYDGGAPEVASRYEPTILGRRNQLVPGEAVGLVFELASIATVLVDEDRLLAVQQDVARLVEEAEPQVVGGLVAEAQLDERLVLVQPAREPAHV